MHHFDNRPPDQIEPVGASASGDVEIVSPVADALGVLAELVTITPTSLAGASIAKSDHGTLLLNPYAWALFAEELRKRLPGLTIAQPARPMSKPIKFVIESGDPKGG